MRTRVSRIAVLMVGLMALARGAGAITITYVNPGPLDSRVFVGFANNASGNLTSDLVTHSSAASRNDTVFGPLPPPFTLPSFDAKAYGAAELGTNLNAPLGSGVRSAFAPLNMPFFQAHGETLAASGAYSSQAFAFSGDTTSTTPTRWIVHVDPSGSETAGTLADVTVTGSIAGHVDVAGSSLADASWNVTTTGFGTVMSGSASQSTPGSTPFTDSGTLTFTLPLGSTFELLVDYDLSTSGSGAGANSTSEVSASLVQISAVLTPPMMMFAPVSGLKLLMQDRYTASGKAKVVMVLKDSTPGSISKGVAAGPPGLSGSLELYQVANPSNRAVYALSTGWTSNGATSAKFSNAAAAPGAAGAKKLLLKPDKALKFIAANLGDGDAASGSQSADDLDLTALTSSDSVMAVVTVDNAADSSTHRMCAQFDAPTLTPLLGGSGVKFLSKTSSLPVACP